MRVRRLAAIGAGLAAIVVVAAVALVALIDERDLRAQLAVGLGEALGRPVELVGPFAVDWFPRTRVEAADVRIFDPQAIVQIEVLSVDVDPWDLLRGQLQARSLRLRGLIVSLTPVEGPGSPLTLPDLGALPVRSVEIDDAQVLHRGEAVVVAPELTLRPRGRSVHVRLMLQTPFELVATGDLLVDGVELQVESLTLSAAPGEAAGRVHLALDGARPRLSGALEAALIRLPPEPGPSGPGSRGRLIPDVSLDPSALDAVTADLDLRIRRLELGAWVLESVHVPLVIDSGTLSTAAQASLAGGGVRLDARVGAASASWSAGLLVEGADAGVLLRYAGAGAAVAGGNLGIRARLTARGTTLHGLIASLDGDVALDASALVVDAGPAELLGADAASMLLRAFERPVADQMHVECAVARFDVEDGVMRSDDGIGAQGRHMNLLGGGSVSLTDERLDLEVLPWARDGIGVSATTVTGTIAVSGPWREPDIGLTGDAAARAGATAGAALLTGGLSLVYGGLSLIAQSLLDRARGDDPCAMAAGRASARAEPARVPTPTSDRSGRADN